MLRRRVWAWIGLMALAGGLLLAAPAGARAGRSPAGRDAPAAAGVNDPCGTVAGTATLRPVDTTTTTTAGGGTTSSSTSSTSSSTTSSRSSTTSSTTTTTTKPPSSSGPSVPVRAPKTEVQAQSAGVPVAFVVNCPTPGPVPIATAAPGPGTPMAATGAEIAASVALACALIAVGAATVSASRRKTRDRA